MVNAKKYELFPLFFFFLKNTNFTKENISFLKILTLTIFVFSFVDKSRQYFFVDIIIP